MTQRGALAEYVKILGRGPSRARGLTQDEARGAMEVILSGTADPEAVGAILMLLRMKGETGEELAGFVQAARDHLAWGGVTPALDWPSYAAGRTRGLPWFLLSAKLVAKIGYPVMLHGWNSHQSAVADVRDGCRRLDITVAHNVTQAQSALSDYAITYVPLEAMSQTLFDLVRLRDVLGLRSCINTVLRLLNPTGARATVQGVFHPSYRDAQSEACRLLGQPSLTVIKGGGGEFERHPSKTLQAFGLRYATPWRADFAPLQDETRRLNAEVQDPDRLTALWDGTWQDDFARDVVVGTAALALHTLGVANPDKIAAQAWSNRHAAQAA